MSIRNKNQPLLDFVNGAFSVISGAISGTTPKVSTWMRVIGVDTLQLALSTTGTVAGAWSVQVASNFRGQDAITLDPKYIQNPATNAVLALPVPAGSALGPTAYQFVIPDGRYTHFQITFTPTSGAGNAQADTGLVTSVPINISHETWCAAWFIAPSTSTNAGQAALEYGHKFYSNKDQYQTLPKQADDTTDDPPVYAAAVDSANSAITIAATVSGAQAVVKRLGALEVSAIRAKWTPTSGFGRFLIFLNSSAHG